MPGFSNLNKAFKENVNVNMQTGDHLIIRQMEVAYFIPIMDFGQFVKQ